MQKKRALFIGGTGTISAAITELLAEMDWELTLLNRGNRNSSIPENVKVIKADIHDEAAVSALIENEHYDVVADFIAFQVSDLERDYRLFQDKTNQFIFISSASAYQKPPTDYLITESTPLANPYWQYSRDKIACEDYLMARYRENAFPITIIRPSHTYCEKSVPLGVHGSKGSYQVLKRMQQGKKVIIHGDGTSLWTLTHNQDFAEAFVGIMSNIHAIGQAIHITSDESVNWNQIYEIIADALNVPLKAVHISSEFLAKCSGNEFEGGLIGDKANTVVFDNSKIKRLVPGFTAEIRADEGIRNAVDYILNHPECQTEDAEFDQWCDRIIEVLDEAEQKMKAVVH